MGVPEYVRELRRSIGHAPLWLPGVTAVVLDPAGERMICVRRSDTGAWTPVTGIVDPGEEPARAAIREVREETGVLAIARRLIEVRAVGPVTHVNGDVASYLDLCFLLEHVEGDPHPADEENLEARWFPVDSLPPLSPRFAEQVALALESPVAARFRA